MRSLRCKFEAQTHTFLPALYGAARRLMSGPDEAEAVVTEVYGRTYRAFQESPDRGLLKRWLFELLWQVCLDTWRRQHQHGRPQARPSSSPIQASMMPLPRTTLDLSSHVGQTIIHAIGHPFRVGIWVEGQFAWTDGDEWMRELAYQPDTLVTQVRLTHPPLHVTQEFHDAIDFHRNILIRHLSAANQAQADREVRLFLHHDCHLSGTDVGDTAYLDPTSGGLFHYKGKVWVLSNALHGGQLGFDATTDKRARAAQALNPSRVGIGGNRWP